MPAVKIDKTSKRIEVYDFIRSSMILIVFLGHILQLEGSEIARVVVLSLSPGLTMSLLGFISGVLLSDRISDTGTFLIHRLTRIYISLISCLCLILLIHCFVGKLPIDSILSHNGRVVIRHTFINLIGLNAFFALFRVENLATIGNDLWFITVIIAMYFVTPILQKIYQHRRGGIHLLLVTIIFISLQFLGLNVHSACNVIISFSLGVYIVVNEKLEYLMRFGALRSIVFSGLLLTIAFLCQAEIFPSQIRVFLFVLYPLAFFPTFWLLVKRLPASVLAVSSFFASLSYEFYILHFYFIGNNLRVFLPNQIHLYLHITISFVVTLMFAFIMSRWSLYLRKKVDGYLLEK